MRLRRSAIAVALGLLVVVANSRLAAAEGGRDRVSFANRIVINDGDSVGDVVCFFCSVEAHGPITGDVVTFLGNLKSTQSVQGDVVAFGGNVVLADGAGINGDLVVFGGDVRKSVGSRVGADQVVFPAAIFLVPVLILGGIIWAASALFRRRSPMYYVPPAR